MMMLMSFGSVPSSLPWGFSSGLMDVMLLTLAVAAVGVASVCVNGLRHRETTIGRGRKGGRMLTPVRHPMPA